MDIKGYDIIREINQGAISTAYLGKQISLNRPVLIKRLNTQWANEKDLLERFRREALICAALKHPNIVNIIDVSTTADNLYLVIEFMEGVDLGKLITTRHPLPFPVVGFIFREVLQGLSYAHTNGVIHRDIKPSNIMIGMDGTVKISDFGLARSSDLPEITMHGEVVGTPAYMSPEQARVSKIDLRSDLFSLGVTGYEMIDGASPFRADNIVASIQKLVKLQPPHLGESYPETPAWYADVVENMMAKKAADRPADAAEILDNSFWKEIAYSREKLAAFLAENDDIKQQIFSLPAFSSPLPAADPPATTANTSPVKKRWPLAIGAILLLLTLSVLWMNFNSTENTQPVINNDPSADSLISSPDTMGHLLAGSPAEDSLSAKEAPLKLVENNLPATDKKPDGAEQTSPASTKENEQTTANSDKNEISQAPAEVAGKMLPGLLQVICSPWADVLIDGKKYGTTPLEAPISLTPGSYTITLKNPSFAAHEQAVTIRPEVTETVSVDFHPREGYIAFQVSPWARVFINGEYYDTTPLDEPVSLSPGKYKFELKNDAFHTWSDSIQITPERIIRREVRLQKK